MTKPKQAAPAAPKKAAAPKCDVIHTIASEVEVLKRESVELKAEVRELAEILAQQFGEPVSALAKKIVARHGEQKAQPEGESF
jgi:hypothetical protein